MKKSALPMLAGLLALAGPLAAGAQEVPGVTEDTIKIGVFGPMTGSAALFGKAVFGVEALYRDINEKGGIHGRTLEIVREDTACDPAKGIAAVKKLVSQEEVFAINGGLCSGVMMAVKPMLVESGVPVVIIGAANGAITADVPERIFQPVATTDAIAQTVIDFAMSQADDAKVAIVSHSDEWGKSQHDPAVEHLKAEYGAEPVQDLTMERGSNNATPQILNINNSDATTTVLFMYPAEVAIFLRDAFKYGMDMPILAPQSVSLKDTLERVGNPAAIENLYVYYPYAHATSAPEMQEWEKLINKHYPNERVESFSFLGMGGTLAMIEALEAAGPDLTREKFVEAMNNIRDFDSGISATPITCTPEDHSCISGGAMATLEDGEVTVLTDWQDQ